MNSNMLFHFIGIGGISMSALAVMLSKKGFKVQGSNLEENDETAMLQTHDIHIFFDHKASNIENADVVVYNSAIGESNPELAYAKEKGLLILTRAQMLASISKDFENCIAICGSHGKTTTTSMIAHILTDAGKKPTVHVGGVMRNYNSNFLIGDNKIFVTEACEYKNNFHALSPSTLVVLNIEADHLDFFKTFSAIEKSFQTMVEKSQSVVIFSDTNLSLPKKTVLFCTESHICNKEEITLQDKPTLWASNL
ncbi:MAG: Mur ligase domain-containing protein, partial [Clostridia bacterium]